MNTASQLIARDRLRVSGTPSQLERRNRYDQAELAKLADSIKEVGLLQPIVARPLNDDFEIVAGERRFLAAGIAGVDEVAVNVRHLTDQQVLEVQLIENLQREGLHELAEAEGYESLLKMGHSAEEIADKVGKSKATVYARMKLLALCAEARKAFYAGDLSASTALLIARIPAADQPRALKHITEKDWHGRPMSFRDAAKYVQETFMLKLSDAPFDCDDATLVPKAGACTNCPMRTGNAPDLFGDVKGANVCTNPGCFKEKKSAHLKRELDKAKSGGDTVIRGAEAKRILPQKSSYMYSSDGAHKQLRNGFARPSDKCLDDPKKRTYAELAGKDAPKVMLQNPDTGRVEKIFKIDDIKEQLKAKGIKPSPAPKDREEAREQDNERREQAEKIELAARAAILRAARDAAPTKLSREDLATLIVNALGYASDEDELYAALELEAPKKSSQWSKRREHLHAQLLKQTDSRLAQLAVVCSVVEESFETYGNPEELEALAKRLGVDVKKVRAESAPAPKEDPKAKATKKTTTAKAKKTSRK